MISLQLNDRIESLQLTFTLCQCSYVKLNDRIELHYVNVPMISLQLNDRIELHYVNVPMISLQLNDRIELHYVNVPMISLQA